MFATIVNIELIKTDKRKRSLNTKQTETMTISKKNITLK